MKRRLWIVGILLAVLTLPTIATAETIVAAGFDEGTVNGRLYRNYIGTASYVDARVTDVVDNYSGMMGDGWANAWQTPYSTSNIRLEVAVRGDSELVDNNYLSFKMEQNNTGTGGRHAGISRSYDIAGGGGIDATKDHAIEFTIRIDEDLAASIAGNTFWDTNNRYTIMDRVLLDGGTSASASASNTNWAIELIATNNDNKWYVSYDGGTASTGIMPAAGVAFEFTIDVHASTGTFDVEIDGANDDSYSGTGFALRNQTDHPGTLGNLSFGTMARKKTSTSPNPIREFSIDGIRITQVPEPTALAMAVGMLLAGLAAGRRR